jgi:hypothetical protein
LSEQEIFELVEKITNKKEDKKANEKLKYIADDWEDI